LHDQLGVFDSAGVHWAIWTWKDIAEAAKKNKLRYGHSGPRTLQAIVLNLMAKNEGFSFINIPYKGSPESQTALIGGHLDLAAGDFSYSLVEAGKIRPILMLAERGKLGLQVFQVLQRLDLQRPKELLADGAEESLDLAAPGGPTKHRMGPFICFFSFFLRVRTARYSRIRSLTFSRS
jgi:hypothetical protein